MKNYLTRVGNKWWTSPLDFFSDALDEIMVPVFFNEKADVMKTDIKETEKDYLLEIEMPGFDKTDIDISLNNDYLTVRAEKKEKEEDDDKQRYIKKERNISCERSFYVGDIEKESIKAKYNNGLLSLVVAKAEEKKAISHSINIE